MQKFDLFAWNEVKPNEKIPHSQGGLRLRLSALAPLYLQSLGVETLAGFASEFDLQISEDVTFRVDAPKTVRVFVETPNKTSFLQTGEKFTNTDRMPGESSAVAEVTRALRQMEIRHRQQMEEIQQSDRENRPAVEITAQPAPAETEAKSE